MQLPNVPVGNPLRRLNVEAIVLAVEAIVLAVLIVPLLFYIMSQISDLDSGMEQRLNRHYDDIKMQIQTLDDRLFIVISNRGLSPSPAVMSDGQPAEP